MITEVHVSHLNPKPKIPPTTLDVQNNFLMIQHYYRPPEGGQLYDMKVVSGYAFLRTYFV